MAARDGPPGANPLHPWYSDASATHRIIVVRFITPMTEENLDELEDMMPDIFSEDNFFICELFNLVSINFSLPFPR